MKKLFLFLIIGLFLPVFSFGAINYERIPSGYTIISPVEFLISWDNWEELCLYNFEDAENWKVAISQDPNYEIIYYSPNYSSTTQNVTFELDLPVQTYIAVNPLCDNAGTGYPENWTWGEPFEWDDDNPIFEVIKSTEYVTTANLNLIKNYITDLFESIGVLVFLIIGIPLAFIVIKRILAIVPKK